MGRTCRRAGGIEKNTHRECFTAVCRGQVGRTKVTAQIRQRTPESVIDYGGDWLFLLLDTVNEDAKRAWHPMFTSGNAVEVGVARATEAMAEGITSIMSAQKANTKSGGDVFRVGIFS